MAQLPGFHAMPIRVYVDAANPTLAEVNTYRTLAEQWRTDVLNNLSVFNPNHGYAAQFPNAAAIAADVPTRIVRIDEITVYMIGLFPIYAAAYAQWAGAIAAGNQPAPPAPAAPRLRPPKTKLPDEFTRKSATVACNFIHQCKSYTILSPFVGPEQQIHWTLQLMAGEASQWRDEQLQLFDQVPPPVHLGVWNTFVTAFEKHWTDPYKEEKALDKIMLGQVTQCTSVKAYNDQFNELLSLTSESGVNLIIARTYETGLKTEVRNTAITPLIANPAMTFHEKQALMIRIDESLMQAHSSTAAQARRQFTLNSHVPPNWPGNQGNHVSSTPVPQIQTPIKVEATRQYTHLTDEECENLRQMGACFQCRQRGHMINQCPRNAQIASIIPDTSGQTAPTMHSPNTSDTKNHSAPTPNPASAPDF